jgi:acyl-CoA hydrolase
VRVDVWSQQRFGGADNVHVTEATVTMVAVDDAMRPVPVGQLD